MTCDLHMHSTASDGTDAPEDLPRLARAAGLDAIALTDHDTTAGLPACAEAAAELDLAFVPGIELSADPQFDRDASHARAGTMHILGLFVRHDDPQLRQIEGWLREARAQRNPQMIQRLNELGVRIDEDEVREVAGGAIVGRPHIAQVLVQKGYVKSMHEAFARYLGEGAAAHVRKDRLSPAKAISAIHHAGGLALLAHPVQLHLPDPDDLEHVVARLVDLGLDGIETRHSDHTPRDVEHFTRLARRFNLLVTGGSDYHGSRKTVRLGQPRVPIEVYHALLEAHLGRAHATGTRPTPDTYPRPRRGNPDRFGTTADEVTVSLPRDAKSNQSPIDLSKTYLVFGNDDVDYTAADFRAMPDQVALDLIIRDTGVSEKDARRMLKMLRAGQQPTAEEFGIDC